MSLKKLKVAIETKALERECRAHTQFSQFNVAQSPAMNDKVSIETILNFSMNILLTYDLGFYSLPTRKHGANMNLFR